MAAELIADGFGTPPFNYQLLNIPSSIEAHLTDYQYKPTAIEEDLENVNGYTRNGRYPSTRVHLVYSRKKTHRLLLNQRRKSTGLTNSAQNITAKPDSFTRAH
jgi:hypothetical protein